MGSGGGLGACFGGPYLDSIMGAGGGSPSMRASVVEDEDDTRALAESSEKSAREECPELGTELGISEAMDEDDAHGASNSKGTISFKLEADSGEGVLAAEMVTGNISSSLALDGAGAISGEMTRGLDGDPGEETSPTDGGSVMMPLRVFVGRRRLGEGDASSLISQLCVLWLSRNVRPHPVVQVGAL